MLAEARGILDDNPDAGMFPELLEREERKLRRIKRRDGSLNGELTQRELDVLRLLVGELSTRQMAQNLYVAPKHRKNPGQIHLPQARGSPRALWPWRRLTPGGSSSLPHRPINPLGEMCWWVMTNQPVVHYARGPLWRSAVNR